MAERCFRKCVKLRLSMRQLPVQCLEPDSQVKFINTNTVEHEISVTVTAAVDPFMEGSKSSFVTDTGPFVLLSCPHRHLRDSGQETSLKENN